MNVATCVPPVAGDPIMHGKVRIVSAKTTDCHQPD